MSLHIQTLTKLLPYFSFILSSIMFISCSVTPLQIVENRYNNLGEEREIEKIFESESTAVFIGIKYEEQYKDSEIIVLNKMNKDKEWKMYRAENSRFFKKSKDAEIQKKYLEWRKIKNSISDLKSNIIE